MNTKLLEVSWYNQKIMYIMIADEPWFRAKSVTTILGYNDTTQATRKNVDQDDRQKLCTLLSAETAMGVSETPMDYQLANTIFINECGLYALIMNSTKPEARMFKQWVFKDVLPSIRKTGSYMTPATVSTAIELPRLFINEIENIKTNNVFRIENETDLHRRVVRYIRRKFPDAILAPGLGELQKTPSDRMDSHSKGYISGIPDLQILNKNLRYSGMVVEFKTPSGLGKLSDSQAEYLNNLAMNGYKIWCPTTMMRS